MVLTKTISSVSRQHKRDGSSVAYERSNKICTRATLLLSLLVLTSFPLLDIGGHTLFFYSFFFFSFFSLFFSLCLEALFFSMYMSHFFFFCVSFSPSLLRSFAQHNAHTPSHGRDTCAMLRNTRKATLNGIGTQRKKRGYKRWGKLYLLMLGGVKHTNLR